jgi:hypothetical protein
MIICNKFTTVFSHIFYTKKKKTIFLGCVCLLVEECLSPTPFKFPISLYFSKSLVEREKERESLKL